MFTRLISLSFYAGLTLAAAAPSLTYSTYLRERFTPSAVATDSTGNIYLAGNAIVDPSTSQTTVLVLKFNPLTNQYVYLRYLGGSANDSAAAIAVDSAGNTYVAGVTTSPDFPVVGGGKLATPPVTAAERSFVAKLNPAGDLVFSDLLGGSANSYAQAVAVTASGQVLVSGTSVAPGFPSTPGVYSVADTSFAPYLLELDPTGAKLIFSATGIGGNSIALDPSGNIYVAGSTGSLTYPTTPGVYQPAFPVFQTCLAPCHGSFQGPNQYVTKLDPTGSKLIFSTAVSGTGNTINLGMAVDAAGNVYLTGLAGDGYPFTVTPPDAPLGPALSVLATPALPFLTKLDSAGQKLLYSVPVGGIGVKVDSNGSAYVGGILGVFANYDVAAAIPALSAIPARCRLFNTSRWNSAYMARVDPSGNVLQAEFIGGSTLALSGVALSGTTLWAAGSTSLPDFPFTPNALTPGSLKPAPVPGAYLGAIDFSQPSPPDGAPLLGCMVDSANLQAAGPIVPFQLLTIFGSNLGPASPQAAADNSATTLGGVTVTFGSQPATLLYVSSTQINLAVPLLSVGPSGAVMQVTVDGASSPPLQFALTYANPGLFVIPESFQTNSQQFVAVARNADGSLNSSSKPAQPGSVISVFVNGLSPDPRVRLQPPVLYSGAGWTVANYSQESPFVLKVDLQVPATRSSFNCQPTDAAACTATFKVYDLASYLNNSGSLSFGGIVYVTP